MKAVRGARGQRAGQPDIRCHLDPLEARGARIDQGGHAVDHGGRHEILEIHPEGAGLEVHEAIKGAKLCAALVTARRLRSKDSLMLSEAEIEGGRLEGVPVVREGAHVVHTVLPQGHDRAQAAAGPRSGHRCALATALRGGVQPHARAQCQSRGSPPFRGPVRTTEDPARLGILVQRRRFRHHGLQGAAERDGVAERGAPRFTIAEKQVGASHEPDVRHVGPYDVRIGVQMIDVDILLESRRVVLRIRHVGEKAPKHALCREGVGRRGAPLRPAHDGNIEAACECDAVLVEVRAARVVVGVERRRGRERGPLTHVWARGVLVEDVQVRGEPRLSAIVGARGAKQRVSARIGRVAVLEALAIEVAG